MHRIDTEGHVNNRFFEGDPTGAEVKPATILGADWLNAVQEELCAVIEPLKLDKNHNWQLRQAIDKKLKDLEERTEERIKERVKPLWDAEEEIGKIIFSQKDLEESKEWRLCNGAVISGTEYNTKFEATALPNLMHLCGKTDFVASTMLPIHMVPEVRPWIRVNPRRVWLP